MAGHAHDVGLIALSVDGIAQSLAVNGESSVVFE